VPVKFIRVNTFKHSHDSFVEAVEAAGLTYSERILLSEEPMASGFAGVIQALSDAMPWNALAKVIVAWIEAKESRNVMITTREFTVFHAKGYSADEVEKILDKAINLNAIDTEPDKRDSDENT
jgi:hypothetical protein